MESNWALINNGVVVRVIVAAPSEAMSVSRKSGYTDNPIEVTWWPVQAGDTFLDGQFYRDGVKIEKILTPDEKITILGVESTDAELNSILAGQEATDLELRIIALEERNV